ncbi:MAG: mycothiol synthase [Nocardioidaceae bacterium]|nr:mycothiol synthase [Nocardioidaceae bacterium]
MTPTRRVDLVSRLDRRQRDAIATLIEAATAVDGTAALNEQALLTLGRAVPEPGTLHLLGSEGESAEAAALAGYVHLDRSGGQAGTAAECVVHPAHRRAGWGELLVRRAVVEAAPRPLLLWSHGDHPAAARLAERLGFVRVRDLCQLRRRLRNGHGPADQLPTVKLPVGVVLRTFVVGQDESAWLALNGRAFASHPEQGSLGAADLARRVESAWFDPAGFLLAERAGRLVGFHWTKVHPGDDSHPAVGEVYVVGVDPDERGGGLGRALTLAGLHHLRDRGLGEVLLYVEADNAPARRVYAGLGFRHAATDTRYRHPGH